ncbi:tripartite ATP-independent transporter DctM subunit [Virgibacillus natechei]|uniref:Tripartite ATP-independent transporter DctM subunit n=1 Tax=Virgibacillus natechei TaxID=1216297 RepID=A0ABS4ILS3_9BACI|nr:TRAP transporter large permease [Virgibacillus natechei]MBP1971241.1 tripartite ATP-independent transporter DctM subunit [Virgibacillus natechei]UZD12128.1 TRAP transporter large permease [Virgibacillus natechei]
MSSEMIGVIGIVLLIALILFRAPVGLSLFLIGFSGYSYLTTLDVGLAQLGMTTLNIATSYVLSVMPLFILMGMILSYSGLGRELFEGVDKWFGHVKGGMAMATIGASAIFSAISGSANATTATVARFSLPEMKRFGYNPGLSAASVAAGGTLGILLPPSVALILYGVLTMEPIGPLLIAGIVPGILCSLFLMATVYILVMKNPKLAPTGQTRAPLKEQLKAFTPVWPFLLIFVISVGGIYFGLFTPTEAAGVGSFGAFLYTALTGRLNWQKLKDAFDETARLTAMIFVIIIGADLLGSFLAITRIPATLTLFVADLSVSPYVVLVLILLVYLIMGLFMEGIAIQVLTLPIVYPIIIDLGFDGVWFAVIMVLMINIGLLTPPLGVVCYIIHGIDRTIPLERIFANVAPMIGTMVILTVILIIFPEIVTFLPDIMTE